MTDPCFLTNAQTNAGMWIGWLISITAGGSVWWILDKKIEQRWSILGNDGNKNRLASAGALLAGLLTFLVVMGVIASAWRNYFCG